MWNVKSPLESGQELSQPSRATNANTIAEERHAPTWLGQSVILKGELTGAEDMNIEGSLEGTIDLGDHDLVLGTNATIHADVVAKTITIRGIVNGSVTAGHKINIAETGVVEGDLAAPRLAVVEGAVVRGRVQMGTSQTDRETTTPTQPLDLAADSSASAARNRSGRRRRGVDHP
jgi:cytoskeletal protein CcmA (bactofilin family)